MYSRRKAKCVYDFIIFLSIRVLKVKISERDLTLELAETNTLEIHFIRPPGMFSLI